MCTFNVYLCSCPCSEYTIHRTVLKRDDSNHGTWLVKEQGQILKAITDYYTK